MSETDKPIKVTRSFKASVWLEDDWYIAQCLEIDIASQGTTKEEAIRNLREALELHFEEPVATTLPHVLTIEAEISAA